MASRKALKKDINYLYADLLTECFKLSAICSEDKQEMGIQCAVEGDEHQLMDCKQEERHGGYPQDEDRYAHHRPAS